MSQAQAKRYAHLFDTTRCINCAACTVACAATNQPELRLHEDPGWHALPSNIRRVELNIRDRPSLLLVQCQHCDNAPCIRTCPFGAMYKEASTGLVKLDEKRCIGCSYCVAACPYNVRWKHPKTGLPMKCMGKTCESLVAAGQSPACVAACPAEARAFGDLNDPASRISQRVRAGRTIRLLESRGTEPNYFVVV
ncbi:MAG: 4Fe-4S dicluster domain-containing protein [Betaproteobacteria bacterium]|nr:4Fe-4S dicluster domain-containing protein [Betaproteobacteria bacterium]